MIAQPLHRSAPWRRHLAAVAALLRAAFYGTLILGSVAIAIAFSTMAAPRLFGYSTLVVHGGSMGEAIPNGSLVIARRIAADQVQVGDVILVREQSGGDPALPKIHRVTSVQADGDRIVVRTKGDANQTEDPQPYVLADRVLTPARHLPYLGYLVGFVTTRLGWILLSALPAAFLCLFALRLIWFGGERPHAAGA